MRHCPIRIRWRRRPNEVIVRVVLRSERSERHFGPRSRCRSYDQIEATGPGDAPYSSLQGRGRGDGRLGNFFDALDLRVSRTYIALRRFRRMAAPRRRTEGFRRVEEQPPTRARAGWTAWPHVLKAAQVAPAAVRGLAWDEADASRGDPIWGGSARVGIFYAKRA